jgi:hypothetical protein
MKSSCHFFFNHLGIQTQFSNYNSSVSVLHGTNLYSTNLLNLFPLVSISVSWQRIYNALTVNKSANHTLRVENTSTAQQRMSYLLSHPLEQRSVYRALHSNKHSTDPQRTLLVLLCVFCNVFTALLLSKWVYTSQYGERDQSRFNT